MVIKVWYVWFGMMFSCYGNKFDKCVFVVVSIFCFIFVNFDSFYFLFFRYFFNFNYFGVKINMFFDIKVFDIVVDVFCYVGMVRIIRYIIRKWEVREVVVMFGDIVV